MGLTASTGGAVTALAGTQLAPQDLGFLKGLYLVPKGTEIATDALALTESTWLDLINSVDGTRMIALPLEWDIEPTKEDDAYATSSTGNVAFVRAGKLTVKYMVKVTPFVMSQLNNTNAADWDLYKLTSEGFITGTSIDGTKFQPFTLQSYRVEGETPATGDENAIVPITFTHADPSEWNARPSFIQPLKDGVGGVWNPARLEDVKAVYFTVIGTPTATEVVVDIHGYDNVPQRGVEASDVLVLNSSDVVQTVSACVEDVAILGRYTLTIATMSADDYTSGLLGVGLTATQGAATLASDLAKATWTIAP